MADKLNVEHKKELMVKLYIKHNGSISKVCKELGCTPQNFYYHLKTDPNFREQIENEWQSYLNDIEIAMRKSAKGFRVKTTTKRTKTTQTPKGDFVEEMTEEKETYYKPDATAAKLILEAKGRHMGYGTKLNDPPNQSQEGEGIGSDEIE